MNRIDTTFADLRKAGRKGIIAYLTAGDPDLETTAALALQLGRSGAAMLELGVPFSDPVADGPVIQAASSRALQKGVTLDRTLDLVGRLRTRMAQPLLLMTYYNPIFVYGIENFAGKAAAKGLDGVIVPDLPLEESYPLLEALRDAGLYLIYLLAPTSTEDRIRSTVKRAAGFIYCVSVTGVTGAREEIAAGGLDLLHRVRLRTDLPLALGFGISRPGQVEALHDRAEAVIIGSALVRLVEEGGTRDEMVQRVGAYLEQFK